MNPCAQLNQMGENEENAAESAARLGEQGKHIKGMVEKVFEKTNFLKNYHVVSPSE